MLLLENIGDTLPGEFDKVIAPQFRYRGKVRMLKLAEKEIEYNNEFKVYFTSSNPYPNYVPNLFMRTAVINFVVT